MSDSPDQFVLRLTSIEVHNGPGVLAYDITADGVLHIWVCDEFNAAPQKAQVVEIKPGFTTWALQMEAE